LLEPRYAKAQRGLAVQSTNPYTINSRSRGEVNPLRESWADFLNGFNWDWWVTLTFRDRQTTKSANRKWNVWLKGLENELDDRVGYFRVTEIQRLRNCLHFHALMLNLRGARRLTWMDEWERIAGYARIYPYEKSKGANYYLCKYCIKDIADHKFGGLVLKT